MSISLLVASLLDRAIQRSAQTPPWCECLLKDKRVHPLCLFATHLLLWLHLPGPGLEGGVGRLAVWVGPQRHTSYRLGS